MPLEQTTTDQLRLLIEAHRESLTGFRDAAQQTEQDTLASLFRQLAEEHTRWARELQNYAYAGGEAKTCDESVADSVHRVWIEIRGLLNSGDSYSLLSEIAEGEAHVSQAYRDVLEQTAGSAMNNILLRQYAAVRLSRDRVLRLRNQLQPLGHTCL